MADALLRLRAWGHPAIRATHDKTLEFAVEEQISARATCVVAVGTTTSGQPEPIAGLIEVTLTAPPESFTFTALGNSAWQPGSTLIVRRSRLRRPDTFATDADATAADLPRSLVRALADPGTEVLIDVRRAGQAAVGAVVFAYAPALSTTRLAAELVAADLVLAPEADAREAVRAARTARATNHNARSPVGEEAADVLAHGGRLLCVAATVDDEAVTRALATAPEARIEVLGLPPAAALTATAPAGAQTLVVPAGSPARIAEAAALDPGRAIVFRVDAADLDRVLARVADTRPARATAAYLAVGAGVGERVVRGSLTDLPRPERGVVCCRLDPVPTATHQRSGMVGDELIGALLTEGVAATTIARALASTPGWSRKRAYDQVLAVKQNQAIGP
ncbi:MAG: DUF371 domain-containing protein [Actinobacteria bacterium]|nr:DUF371 domain-containing protein [Actinomycetota bacterium]